jgi:hypothetical protein
MIMPYVQIIHEVENCSAWKNVFDRAAEIRKRAGVHAPQFLFLDEIEVRVL